MTATLTDTAAARQRLLEYIERLPNEEVLPLAERLLPPTLTPTPAPADTSEETGEVDLNDPLIYTEEEGRARIEKIVAELEAGAKTIPWEEVKAELRARQAARVQH